jgi:hypothetical protein
LMSKNLVIGLFIIVASIIIGIVFRNPYPCSTSGCGCNSVFEMFADSWSDYTLLFGCILGLWICSIDP